MKVEILHLLCSLQLLFFCNLIKPSNQSSLAQFVLLARVPSQAIAHSVGSSSWIEGGMFQWQLPGLLSFLPRQTGITMRVIKTRRQKRSTMRCVRRTSAVLVPFQTCRADAEVAVTILGLSTHPQPPLSWACPYRLLTCISLGVSYASLWSPTRALGRFSWAKAFFGVVWRSHASPGLRGIGLAEN